MKFWLSYKFAKRERKKKRALLNANAIHFMGDHRDILHTKKIAHHLFVSFAKLSCLEIGQSGLNHFSNMRNCRKFSAQFSLASFWYGIDVMTKQERTCCTLWVWESKAKWDESPDSMASSKQQKKKKVKSSSLSAKYWMEKRDCQEKFRQ